MHCSTVLVPTNAKYLIMTMIPTNPYQWRFDYSICVYNSPKMIDFERREKKKSRSSANQEFKESTSITIVPTEVTKPI